ncbi:hybrid sensor histidine kinase/response regulator [Gaetbulibacter aestuarii]|uniref:histidine kinase n=1 Tax=Gaetbulibacter aestuarii TaxID=1502358 RepID=A0ABW7MYY8_9FLAO
MKQLVLIAYLGCLSLHAQQPVYNIQNSKGQLYEYAQYTNAGNLDLSISDVQHSSFLKYKDLESENHSVGFTSDNYWVKFKIENNDASSKTYYLETGRPITDVVDLYQINGAKISHFKNGDDIPFSKKQVEHRSTVFKLDLPPQKAQQIYIHYKSDGETINLPLTLYSAEAFWINNYHQQMFLGLFYGILFLASIIYLFFYSSLKEKAFLYYGFYVLSIALMQLALDGFLHEYLFTSGGYFNSRLVLITALLSNLYLLKYCEHFLRVNTQLNGFKKAFHVIYGIIGVLFALVFISDKTLELAYPISNLNGLFSLILILATTFTMRFKRMKIDPYFSFGIFFLVIGLLGFVMNNLSLLPNNFYTLNSAKFGSGFEVIFLSLSMTNLIRKLRIEKERSQEEALLKSEEISGLKTYFMSNMSHELRTPINAIMGVADDEIAKNPSPEIKNALDIIKNASVSLLSNVNDILDFEKIEKNELKLNKQPFDPKETMRQICTNWKLEAEKKGLKFISEIDENIPKRVIGDDKRLVQILNNLLSNAVKFTEKGQVVFKLISTPQPNNVHRFSIQISDTGVGMDVQFKNQAFDSFNQMRLDNKRKFGGIGLGLTIVNHILSLCDGNIKIESELGKGTDVFIDFRLQEQKLAKLTKVEDSKTENEMPVKVLMVEDNKMNQMVLARILKTKSEIVYSIANNGQEAIDKLKEETFDIILMDLQMPVMDGYEATEIIKSGALGTKVQDLPIIAVTADATQETKERVLNMGMIDHMTKPIEKELILQKIFRYSQGGALSETA